MATNPFKTDNGQLLFIKTDLGWQIWNFNTRTWDLIIHKNERDNDQIVVEQINGRMVSLSQTDFREYQDFLEQGAKWDDFLDGLPEVEVVETRK